MEESQWNSDASSETGERKTKRLPSQKTEEFPVKKEEFMARKFLPKNL